MKGETKTEKEYTRGARCCIITVWHLYKRCSNYLNMSTTPSVKSTSVCNCKTSIQSNKVTLQVHYENGAYFFFLFGSTPWWTKQKLSFIKKMWFMLLWNKEKFCLKVNFVIFSLKTLFKVIKILVIKAITNPVISNNNDIWYRTAC